MVLDVLISVYNGVTDKVGTVTYLSNFLGSKRHIERIEALRAEKDEKRRSAMKKSLPAATVSGVFHPTRSADNLVQHSGFISIDIDGKDNPGVSLDDMRTALLCRPYVAYAAISVSGNGMFAIIPIARTDNEGHGAHFDALKEEFAQYGIKLDASCRDTSRLRFLSYDPEAYINENAEVYTRVIETKVYPYEMERPALPATCILPDETKVRRCVDKIIQYGIDITGGYEDWLRIGMSLAELGEQGRSYFHAVSSQYADYKRHEADEKFTQCLRRSRSTNSGRGPIGLATFFHICMDYGITYRKEQYE